MLAQQAVNGLMLGSVYALIGIGYSLVFGMLRMLNLAHAYLFMAGPFIAFALIQSRVPVPLALCLSLVATAGLGVVLYLVAFRPIKPEHALGGFVASLAFGTVLQVIVVNFYGTLPRTFTTGLRLPEIQVGGILLSGVQLASLVLSAVLMVGLLYVIGSTRLGRNIRAIAENARAAAALGISVQRTVTTVFMLSAALAGLAGVMVALRFDTISAYMGDTYAVKALAVIVIGGLGDVRGVMLAGLFLGTFEVLFAAFAPTGWSEAFVWLLLIAVLLLKPAGIFGTAIKPREI